MRSGGGVGEAVGLALDARPALAARSLQPFEEQPMKTWQTLWFLVLGLSLALLGCKGGEADKAKLAGEKEYDVRGKVVAVDAAKPAVTLDHEDIPGLMKAMQMEFVVQDPKILEGIKAGDNVQGRLKKGNSGYVITHLEKR
jgi:protein SCO1/2